MAAVARLQVSLVSSAKGWSTSSPSSLLPSVLVLLGLKVGPAAPTSSQASLNTFISFPLVHISPPALTKPLSSTKCFSLFPVEPFLILPVCRLCFNQDPLTVLYLLLVLYLCSLSLSLLLFKKARPVSEEWHMPLLQFVACSIFSPLFLCPGGCWEMPQQCVQVLCS